MHTYFSENRLLAQYLPEASRPAGPEAQRQDSEVQKMLNTIEQKATEFMNSMTPEQKRQMDGLAKEFMNNFGEIKSNFFAAVKQEKAFLESAPGREMMRRRFDQFIVKLDSI